MIGVLPIVSKTLFNHIKCVALIEGEIKLKKLKLLDVSKIASNDFAELGINHFFSQSNHI
jgi:hypothetical protein